MIAFPSGVIPPTPGQVPSFGAIGASLHTEVNIFNTCTHCLDSYRSRWSGMASHSLLQRRFAPRKVVRLLPDKRGQFTACILYSFMTRQTVRTDFYFFSLFSGNRKPQGFLFPWGLLILLYAFTISAVSAFLLTLTLSMTGFPFLSLEMTSIRKRSNSGSNS